MVVTTVTVAHLANTRWANLNVHKLNVRHLNKIYRIFNLLINKFHTKLKLKFCPNNNFIYLILFSIILTYRYPIRAQRVGSYLHAVVQLWGPAVSGSGCCSQVSGEVLSCPTGTGEYSSFVCSLHFFLPTGPFMWAPAMGSRNVYISFSPLARLGGLPQWAPAMFTFLSPHWPV